MQRGGGGCNVAAAPRSAFCVVFVMLELALGAGRGGKNPSNDRFDAVNLYSFVNRVVHFVVTLSLMIMSFVD